MHRRLFVHSCKRSGKLVLFFLNLSIQCDRTFLTSCRHSWRCRSLPRLSCFSYRAGNLRSVPKGLHGHARQLKRCLDVVCSFRVWKAASQRCGWAWVIWLGEKPFVCRASLAGYLARWGTLHLPTGRAKIGTRCYRPGSSGAHFSKPSVPET